MNGSSRSIAAVLTAIVLTFGLAGSVAAAPPPNDDIGSPSAIALPSSTSLSTVEATTGATDPGDCVAGGHTVWFSYTAASAGDLVATTFGSDFDTVLVIGTSNGAGGINVIACNDDSTSLLSAVRFDAVAGTTYLLMVASYGDTVGGSLTLNLDVAPPPLTMELHVDSTGGFTRYGVATIRGTITCSSAASFSELFLDLTQRVGRLTIRGFADAALECGPAPTRWAVDVTSNDGKFLGGVTQANVFAVACGIFDCVEAQASLAIRLRH